MVMRPYEQRPMWWPTPLEPSEYLGFEYTPIVPKGQQFWADLENPSDFSDEEVRQAEQLLTGQEP